MSNKEKKKYTVYVDDNFHYMDEEERYKGGEFDNCESAVKHCIEIVEDYLINAYKSGMTWNQLLSSYKTFGEDRWISSSDENCKFSAWNYAESKCKEICHPKKE